MLQARVDENSGAEQGFEKILNNVLPYMIDRLSVKVLAELTAYVGRND